MTLFLNFRSILTAHLIPKEGRKVLDSIYLVFYPSFRGRNGGNPLYVMQLLKDERNVKRMSIAKKFSIAWKHL